MHKTVNHKVSFISEEGYHTNHVEGVHGWIKRMAWRQFSRLPSVNRRGLPQYESSWLWRAILNIQSATDSEANMLLLNQNINNTCAFVTVPMIPFDKNGVPIITAMRQTIYDLNFKIQRMNGELTP